jgi:hypothetical protein
MSRIKEDLKTIYLVEVDEYDINDIFYMRFIGHPESGMGFKDRYIEPHRIARCFWDDEKYYERVENARRLLKGQMEVRKSSDLQKFR